MGSFYSVLSFQKCYSKCSITVQLLLTGFDPKLSGDQSNCQANCTTEVIVQVHLIEPFDQCDQIWQNFATLAKFKKHSALFLPVYLIFGQTLNPHWQNLHAFEQICFVVNGQIMINNLAIWSHYIRQSSQWHLKCVLPTWWQVGGLRIQLILNLQLSYVVSCDMKQSEDCAESLRWHLKNNYF